LWKLRLAVAAGTILTFGDGTGPLIRARRNVAHHDSVEMLGRRGNE
jgi:hypothetical protein